MSVCVCTVYRLAPYLFAVGTVLLESAGDFSRSFPSRASGSERQQCVYYCSHKLTENDSFSSRHLLINLSNSRNHSVRAATAAQHFSALSPHRLSLPTAVAHVTIHALLFMLKFKALQLTARWSNVTRQIILLRPNICLKRFPPLLNGHRIVHKHFSQRCSINISLNISV
jgi:hypothetical protein